MPFPSGQNGTVRIDQFDLSRVEHRLDGLQESLIFVERFTNESDQQITSSKLIKDLKFQRHEMELS